MLDSELQSLSSQELKDLKAKIEDAIRAEIRKRNTKDVPVPPARAPTKSEGDLARERDAWLAKRKA